MWVNDFCQSVNEPTRVFCGDSNVLRIESNRRYVSGSVKLLSFLHDDDDDDDNMMFCSHVVSPLWNPLHDYYYYYSYSLAWGNEQRHPMILIFEIGSKNM